MLDDFSTVNIASKKPEIPAASASTAAPTALSKDSPPPPAAAAATAPKADEDVLSDDDFAKQLQDGMAELMGNMDSVTYYQHPLENKTNTRSAGRNASPI